MALELVLRARHCLSLDRLDEAAALAKAAAADPASAADALHILGVAHLRQGRLDDAEKALRQAIARDPRVAAYHNDLGNLLQDRGRLNEAIACYRRALRLNPALAEAWNDLGTARYAKGELEAAVDCYRQALRLRSDHVVAHANLGAVYRKLGLLADARRALQRELALRLRNAAASLWRRLRAGQPAFGNADWLAAVAQGQLQAGNARHAAEIARRAIELAPRHAAALRVLSAACLRQERPAEALTAARAACEAAADDPAARLQLARALAASARTDEAASAYDEALRAQPDSAAALAELAALRLANGEAASAERLLRRAIALQLGEPDLRLKLGEAHHRQGAFEDAEAAYRRALELDPHLLAAQVRMADVLRDSGRIDEALTAARRALELDDESALAHFALAMAYCAKGRGDTAIQSFLRALELEPQRTQTMQQLALALREADRMEEALGQLRTAVRLRPEDAGLHSDLGLVLADMMRYEDALDSYQRAARLAPDSANILQRQALLRDHLGDRAGGEALLRRALELAPQDHHLHYNIGLQHLKYAEYAPGWDGYEHRRTFEAFIGRHRRFPLPEWNGEALGERTLLVLPEQGLGDEIMFGSCIPQLAARAQHVIVECDPKLEALFRRSLAGCTVVSRQRTLANDWIERVEPKPDLQVWAGSLAGHFRRNVADFPQQPYLRADDNAVGAWRSRLDGLGPGRKIGLSWRGGVGYTGKTRRSLSLEQLLPVLRLPGVQFVNLQYTDAREELRALASRHSVRVHHWQEAIDDYDQTAALVCALDGVLTVCTAIVHLSGALGRPTLVMVPFGADWRYGGAGERMPWYASVRLLRQGRVGEWGDVLKEVSGRIASAAWP